MGSPWALAAGLLTTGIVLGSWWAYYELGWGGWWFWDPVENAFLCLGSWAPHYSIRPSCRKKGYVKKLDHIPRHHCLCHEPAWYLLVRSGVLTSVHAFASESSRGVSCCCSSSQLALRWRCLFGEGRPQRVGFFGQSLARVDSFNNFLLTVRPLPFYWEPIFVVFGCFDLGKVSRVRRILIVSSCC